MNKKEIQLFGQAFNGKTPSKTEQRDEGLPILKIKDIDENGRFRGVFESFVDSNFYKKHSKKKLKAGDTIILNAAHNSDYVGSKNAFIHRELEGVIATGEWLIVRPDSAHPQYVNHFLKSPHGRQCLKKNVKGIHLYPKDVERIEIPFPPINDQIRIAHLLGKVEGLIAQRKQHLRQLDELLKSVFLEMFGDPIKNPHNFPVRKLSDFYINPKEGTKCGPFGSALKKDEFVDSGIPVWNMDNIDPTGRMLSPFRMWITSEKFKELSSYSVVDGDIVISRAGTVGKMCVAKMNGEAAIISTNLIRLRLGDKLRPLHVVALMTYCKGRIGRLKVGPDGAFTHMNTGILDKLEFPYPSTELQDQFATIVEKVETLKSSYQQSLTDLESLYGALSQKAFKGELDLSQVPLPENVTDIKKKAVDEEANKVVTSPPQAPIEPLSFAHLDEAPLSNPQQRKALLGQIVEQFLRDKAPNTSFTIDDFWQEANRSSVDYMDEESIPLGQDPVDYDAVKAWLFDALAAEKLEQNFDNEHNRIQLKTLAGEVKTP